MINVLSTLDVFLSTNGLMLPGLGTTVGSVFAAVVFGMSVLGMPMLLDRDVDFFDGDHRRNRGSDGPPIGLSVVGRLRRLGQVDCGGAFFLKLFVAVPILGHASWHLYRLETSPSGVFASDITI
ncbi:MAG: putative membrane protein [Yoonia sp.]|jgi:uncharacterized membrane protein